MNPDFYLFQIGPMNKKKPVPPAERPSFRMLSSEFLKVDEKRFSRANSVSFDNVIMLNKVFSKAKRN